MDPDLGVEDEGTEEDEEVVRLGFVRFPGIPPAALVLTFLLSLLLFRESESSRFGTTKGFPPTAAPSRLFPLVLSTLPLLPPVSSPPPALRLLAESAPALLPVLAVPLPGTPCPKVCRKVEGDPPPGWGLGEPVGFFFCLIRPANAPLGPGELEAGLGELPSMSNSTSPSRSEP